MADVGSAVAAVLVSGGIDSAVLYAKLRSEFAQVVPIYVRGGLRWEVVELAAVEQFLDAVGGEGRAGLVVLEEPIADVYGPHWSTAGTDVPGFETEDEAVYLPGRNVLLTAKAAVWCRLRDVRTLALGSLGSNPFPDATDEFFLSLESVLNQAMDGALRIVRPFASVHKTDVLRMGRDLPLHLTFSCINPVGGLHCGACNKCAERIKGFVEAGVVDRTVYHRDVVDSGLVATVAMGPES